MGEKKVFSTHGIGKLHKHMKFKRNGNLDPNLIPYIHEVNCQPNIKAKTKKHLGEKNWRILFVYLDRQGFCRNKKVLI